MKKAAPFILIILLFAVGGWYFFTGDQAPIDELPKDYAPPAIPAPAVEPEPEPEVQVAYPGVDAETEPVFVPEPLPALHESDGEIKPAIGEVVGPGFVGQYLVKDQVISRLVATVDALTSRQVPPVVNPVKPVGSHFAVEKEGERFVLSDENFARYDPYVEMFKNADTAMLLATYDRYHSLFQQAWEENGQQGSFDERAIEVIDNLLATPDVPGPIYLVKPEAFYLYEDPALESLQAGQKILIRMGSANAAVVKQKLREIRSVLEKSP